MVGGDGQESRPAALVRRRRRKSDQLGDLGCFGGCLAAGGTALVYLVPPFGRTRTSLTEEENPRSSRKGRGSATARRSTRGAPSRGTSHRGRRPNRPTVDARDRRENRNRYRHRLRGEDPRRCLHDGSVRFRYTDYRRTGASRQKTMTLTATEFIRRMLLHERPVSAS